MPKFVAFFVVIVVIVSPLLVEGMPSLTQHEGNYKNDNNDELVAEEQHIQDEDDVDVGYPESARQMEEATDRKHMKKVSSKRKGTSSRRKSDYQHSGREQPADIVLLVDTGLAMHDVCVETKRLHEITQKWALKYRRRRNRIAIAQFDKYYVKILLKMGKWRESSLKRAIKHIKCPAEYGPDEIYDGYNNFNGDNDFTDFKAKQMFTNSPPRRGTKRFAIVISYGSGIDGFDEVKLFRKQFNVHIKAVLIAANAEEAKAEAKADGRNNPLWLARVNKIVTDPNNDIVFENIGNCRYDQDCAKGVECFLPTNLRSWNNLGFCGCLYMGTIFDTNKYSLDDCCRHVPLPPYARPEHYRDECY